MGCPNCPPGYDCEVGDYMTTRAAMAEEIAQALEAETGLNDDLRYAARIAREHGKAKVMGTGVTISETPRPDPSLLDLAVRAALAECAEQRQLAADMLDRTDNPLTQAAMLARIVAVDRVARRVLDLLGQAYEGTT